MMAVDEVYAAITKTLTPEQALKRMLTASIGHYKKLKFNGGDEIDPVMLIAMAAQDIGWGIKGEDPKKQKYCRGLVVGTEEYMKNIVFIE